MSSIHIYLSIVTISYAVLTKGYPRYDFRNAFKSVLIVMFIFVEICIFGKIMFSKMMEGACAPYYNPSRWMGDVTSLFRQ